MNYKVILTTSAASLFFVTGYTQNNDTIASTADTSQMIKGQNMKEVVVESRRSLAIVKADRTIFNFAGHDFLTNGSTLEGLKKLPGLLVSDVTGVVYQGKQLTVYVDGRPVNLSSGDLNNYLEGMPGNSVDRVEVITQPGAEFPATGGGAIVNIITSNNSMDYFSATYGNGISYAPDSKNLRFNNNLSLNSRIKNVGLQLQIGQNHIEQTQNSRFFKEQNTYSTNNVDRTLNYTFLNAGLKYYFKRDRLILNYRLSHNRDKSSIYSFSTGFQSDDNGLANRNNHDLAATYQKRFKQPGQTLDVNLSYNTNRNLNNLESKQQNTPALLDNENISEILLAKIDYSQSLTIGGLRESSINGGLLMEGVDFRANSFEIRNFKYQRNTLAAYLELKGSYHKWDFILGNRLEKYDISGAFITDKVPSYNKLRYYPNATLQYNIMKGVHLNMNYNSKITLPNLAALNPNNVNYVNPNLSFGGNPGLAPTLSDNYEVKLSAFNYFFVSYNIRHARNFITDRLVDVNGTVNNVMVNVPELMHYNFNIGIPVPFMIFTKGLKQTLQFNFNPDEMNFLYAQAGNNRFNIEGITSKSIWNLHLTTQLVLPLKVKLMAQYYSSSKGGNHYYFMIQQPLNNQFDLNLSRRFWNNNLSASVFVYDLFNTNRNALQDMGSGVSYYSKYDTRRFGLSLSYKFRSGHSKKTKEDQFIDDQPRTETPTNIVQ
jgi:hypothetical protein